MLLASLPLLRVRDPAGISAVAGVPAVYIGDTPSVACIPSEPEFLSRSPGIDSRPGGIDSWAP